MSGGRVATLSSYAELTKPRLLPLVVLSGLPPLLMTAAAPGPAVLATILAGILLCAASANVLNCYVERERDALMERTRSRPLPAARLTPRAALAFGLTLGVVSTVVLLGVGGGLSAGLGVASILFYVFVYTVWLKPRSAWNAVIGGVAGAAAPLIADAAVHGQVTAAGWWLFAIIFFWQPPHVWAIALYRKRDYESAGIPMLPNVIGDQPTRWRMLGYTIGLIPVAVAPAVLGLLGPLYAVAATGLCGWFVLEAVRVVRERTDAAARRMFRVSLAVLFGLFLAMLADLAL
ncbi:MAG: heme o synthase [Myxococcota bacterium]